MNKNLQLGLNKVSTVKINIGEEVFNQNSKYKIIAILDLEHVCVRSSIFTGKKKDFHIFHISELSSNLIISESDTDVISSVDLMGISDEEWVDIHNKADLFNRILQSPYDDRREELRKAANELNISEPTLYRQLQKYKDSNGDPTSLLRKKRVDKGRFEPEVEKIIQSCINQYLSTDELKVSDIFRNLQAQIYQYNNLNGTSFKTPHINTLRHRISQLTTSEMI